MNFDGERRPNGWKTMYLLETIKHLKHGHIMEVHPKADISSESACRSIANLKKEGKISHTIYALARGKRKNGFRRTFLVNKANFGRGGTKV